ncbi:hypothetical protein [Streptomyces sp. NPDC006739]|uniref:hypothetical protein n=1 Tax=Streptomyces sp. NPDC006739 TaxID=3364763 RepID=UPI0036841D7D
MLYEFRVSCPVPPEAAKTFPVLRAVSIAGQTVFYGVVLDQAHLFGLMGRFRRCRLPLAEMQPLATRPP